MPSTENLTTLSNFDEQYCSFVFKSVILMLKNISINKYKIPQFQYIMQCITDAGVLV